MNSAACASLCAGPVDVTRLLSKQRRNWETKSSVPSSFPRGGILGPASLWLVGFFVFAKTLEVSRCSQGYIRPDVNLWVAKLKVPSPKEAVTAPAQLDLRPLAALRPGAKACLSDALDRPFLTP